MLGNKATEIVQRGKMFSGANVCPGIKKKTSCNHFVVPVAFHECTIWSWTRHLYQQRIIFENKCFKQMVKTHRLPDEYLVRGAGDQVDLPADVMRRPCI